MSSPFWDEWFKRMRERRGFFFPEIDRMIEEMEKEMSKSFQDMQNKAPHDMVRITKSPDGSIRREYGPFVYGYTVKIDPEGKPIIREFGNIKPGLNENGQSIDLRNQREPLIDIIDEKDAVKVVAELPGVKKNEIKLYLDNNLLTIDVDSLNRKYYKELQFPFEVEATTARSTYINGVLETTINKKQSKSRGTELKIE